MNNYNVGAIVTLKSGGPPMTVEAPTADAALCTWFDVQQIKQSATFKRQALKRAQASTGPVRK